MLHLVSQFVSNTFFFFFVLRFVLLCIFVVPCYLFFLPFFSHQYNVTQFNLKTIIFMFMAQCIIGRRYICACFCEIFPFFVIRNIKFILLVTVPVCATNVLQDKGHVIGCKGGLKNSCKGRLCEQRLFSDIKSQSL